MQSARTTRQVWGGNPNKYLTGGQMSEKRNLAHWSILALCSCNLRRVRGLLIFCFHQSYFGHRAFLPVLLLIIRENFFCPLSGGNGKFLFPIVPARVYLPVHSLIPPLSRFAKNRRKKSSKSFSRLTACCAVAGRVVFSFLGIN